jgi:hypothetical protein
VQFHRRRIVRGTGKDQVAEAGGEPLDLVLDRGCHVLD